MIGGVLLEFLIIPLNFILKSNVQFTLAYMDEQVEWKVKKHIARFTYQPKKYKTGKRFGGNYIYKINQESELYKQIINFYDLNRKTVE